MNDKRGNYHILSNVHVFNEMTTTTTKNMETDCRLNSTYISELSNNENDEQRMRKRGEKTPTHKDTDRWPLNNLNKIPRHALTK